MECEHLVGEVSSDGDFNEVVCADELTEFFNSQNLERILHDKSTIGFYGLYKFNYCPDCGAKIDWDKIIRDLLTNKK
jgi:hypothetical protein